MSFIRSAIRLSSSFPKSDPVISRSWLPFLQESRKCLSTVNEQQPPSSLLPPSPGGSPGEGKFYGKLSGFSKHSLKTDILNVLDGCNVTPDDLKFNYLRVLCSSLPLPHITEQWGISQRKAARSQWDPIVSYEGKVVALHGLPENTITEEIDRFLSGCLYYPGSIQFLTMDLELLRGWRW